METKPAQMTRKMSDSIAYSALNPKSLCTCGHDGDGAKSQHGGYGGHGACMATPEDGRRECQCGQFTWGGWKREYKQFMIKRGHKEGVR